MQEKNMFVNLLARLVQDTENHKLETSEQVIQVLVDELVTSGYGPKKQI